MRSLTVDLGERSYRIEIGKDALAGLEAFRDRPCLVISDENVAPLYLDGVLERLGSHAESLVLPPGETAKSPEQLSRIWDVLAARRMPRDGLLVALGGGVVGDIAGFAAATWMRGTPFLQLPTSLLAQVDASVGGKTAINLPAGKNLVGAFHQPEAVLIDTSTLSTLPGREFAAGLAEIVKAALIEGEDFLGWLETNADALASRESQPLEEAIERSCRLKARIVAEDERESGQRALLNLGHTFGHAIETAMGHGTWLHGEAIATGLMLALRLSEIVLQADPSLRRRIGRLLEQFHLPTKLPAELATDRLLDLMAGDKKVDREGWKLVLVATPGNVQVLRGVSLADIRHVLENRG